MSICPVQRQHPAERPTDDHGVRGRSGVQVSDQCIGRKVTIGVSACAMPGQIEDVETELILQSADDFVPYAAVRAPTVQKHDIRALPGNPAMQFHDACGAVSAATAATRAACTRTGICAGSEQPRAMAPASTPCIASSAAPKRRFCG